MKITVATMPASRRLAASRRTAGRLATVLAATVVLLVGCAPSAAGTSGSAPVVVGAASVPVEQGKTYFLRFDLALEQFKLTPRDLQVSLWVPSGYASDDGDASSMFGLNGASVADGWTVDLQQVKVRRSTIAPTKSFGTSTTAYAMWAVVRVQVPDGIIPGPYRFRGTLQARSGATVPLAATLQVVPSSGGASPSVPAY